MTPLEAWKALLEGRAEPELASPLDYHDETQVCEQVLIDGEPWVVLIRRAS